MDSLCFCSSKAVVILIDLPWLEPEALKFPDNLFLGLQRKSRLGGSYLCACSLKAQLLAVAFFIDAIIHGTFAGISMGMSNKN